ncbi:MAG: zinc metallopeptidase [Oscillospiraceae bacterium]|nr:zinc metallopeptidase [Oscillospiraceae bacterium]
MPFFYMDQYYLLLVVPALILSIIASARVKSTFRSYSKFENSRGVTGAMAAKEVLAHYNLNDVSVERVSGELTDHYDPRDNVIRLSESVYNSTSIAAVGVACHEAGHAAQHANGYAPIKVRNAILPVTRIGSNLGIPLALIGLLLRFDMLISIGLLLYALVAVFQFVTLPVEFNASRRAMNVIDQTAILSQDETKGAKKVLSAAAMTYVAALAVSIASILRLLLLVNRRR